MLGVWNIMVSKSIILIFGLLFLFSTSTVNAVTAPTVENTFQADILFDFFILTFALVFIAAGLILKNNTLMIIGAVGLLLLALFIMSLGMFIQSGNQVVQNTTETPNATVIGTCFNQSSYSYNDTLDLTQTTNTTVCPYSFSFTKNVATATSASWVRLPRTWEMSIATILLIASMYLLIMCFMGFTNKAN